MADFIQEISGLYLPVSAKDFDTLVTDRSGGPDVNGGAIAMFTSSACPKGTTLYVYGREIEKQVRSVCGHRTTAGVPHPPPPWAQYHAGLAWQVQW